MTKLEFEVSFTTPAFVGNADQQAQWRTPPFKALIRQWWRVVHAPKVGFDWRCLRAAENLFFGFAGDEGASRSQLRLRLSSWDAGGLETWPAGGKQVKHPKVKFPVGSELYLGFGPLEYDKAKKSTRLGTSKTSEKQRTAIDVNRSLRLSLMFPDEQNEEIEQTMRLVAWFGTLGSRSRNGWGALKLAPASRARAIPQLNAPALTEVVRPLDAALKLDWPHAIGASKDGKPLVWLTQQRNNWREAMCDLAEVKIAFRTIFPFNTGGPSAQIEERHVLAYPVTNHVPKEWGAKKRLANQIRFKVLASDNGVRGLIVHLPCRMPSEFDLPPSIQSKQEEIWQRVHEVLDKMTPILNRLS